MVKFIYAAFIVIIIENAEDINPLIPSEVIKQREHELF